MKTIVTKAGLEALKEKLVGKIDLLKLLREEKAHAYNASGDGWHDNPGWIQLGQQEEMMAKEVSLIQQKISSAIIVDPSKLNNEKVQIGCTVEFILINKHNVPSYQTLSIVGSGESDVKNKKISYDSPMGKALFNMKIGDEKEVYLPGGPVSLKIETISYE